MMDRLANNALITGNFFRGRASYDQGTAKEAMIVLDNDVKYWLKISHAASYIQEDTMLKPIKSSPQDNKIGA